METDIDYPGLGIWINKDYVEFKFQAKIHHLIENNIPLENSSVGFSGKQVLLIYNRFVKFKKLKKKISQLCTSKGIFCHVITVSLEKQNIIILNFNETLRMKDTRFFDTSYESPKWYPIDKYDYVCLMNLIQCDTYEEIYLDAVKSYVDEKTRFIMNQLKGFVTSMTTTLSSTNQIEQCNDRIDKIEHRMDLLCKDVEFSKVIEVMYNASSNKS